jgi:uncharacterized membrane protein YadS
MNTNQISGLNVNKRRIGVALGVAFLLLIPLAAMQFTKEVQWTLGDFIVAGVLLLGAGLTFELIARKIQKTGFKIAAFAVTFLALALIWAELAVGVFGTPFAGN